jgi:hypothetical protein
MALRIAALASPPFFAPYLVITKSRRGMRGGVMRARSCGSEAHGSRGSTVNGAAAGVVSVTLADCAKVSRGATARALPARARSRMRVLRSMVM